MDLAWRSKKYQPTRNIDAITPFRSLDYTPNQKIQLPVTCDTDRSPIPIDPETLDRLNQLLPPNLDGSQNDLVNL